MTGKADAVRAVSQQFKDRTNAVIEGVMAHLRNDNAKEILGPGLSPLIGRGSLKSIVTFALYADVLRMVRDMVMADGEVSDEEVQESLGLLSVLAAGFAKVRKEYASFASLTALNARDYLTQYSSDLGLFGHANESTKWAGVNTCRNIEALCRDSGPLNAIRSTLVAWATSLASSDGMSPKGQRHLDAIREVCTSARDPHTCVLTSEIADRFLADNNAVDLSEYTELEDGAAEKLCTKRWSAEGHDTGPDLNGVLSLNASAAKHLAGLEGDLFLGECTEVGDDAIKILCQHARALFLGLTSVSDRAAEWLSSKPGHLCLEHLADLSPAAAQSLAYHPNIFVDTTLWPDDAAASYHTITHATKKPNDAEPLSDATTPEGDKLMSDESILADYQACEDLLAQDESRDDYIKSHSSRWSLWRQAAEEGDPRGQLLYGLCFFYGHGEEESETTALDWFRKSAEQGDANAQYTLGLCYCNGWGVTADEKTSTQWLRKAAAQGYRAVVKVLTENVAREFLAEDPIVSLHEFTEIEDDAAELLSGYRGTLDLMSLYSLSEAAAESLSKHSGTLNLQSVGELSATAAKSLAKHRGDVDLSGLETLCGVEMSIFRNLSSLAPFSLFKNFTPEMEALYREAKQKSEDDLSNLSLYCHSPSYGRSSHEAFFEFWDTLSKCRKFPLWLMYDDENESWNFFQGSPEELTSNLQEIAGT